MMDNGRTNLLRIQYDKLIKLSERSELIRVEPVDVAPGWPPEKYNVSFSCTGIAGIRQDGAPIFSTDHRMSIYLDHDYPRTEPKMLFMTPIWHPNISSEEPRQICTDRSKTWWAGKDLDQLALTLGEMVCYQLYHAKWEPPFPQDKRVAEWVLEYAEPCGIVGPGKSLESRPFQKPHRIVHAAAAPASTRKIKLGAPSTGLGDANPDRAARERANEFICSACGARNHININA
jgi:hypothetical protein